MARHIGGFTQTLLSLSVLAVLAGCGGPPVTQNPLPAGGSSGPPTGTNPGNGGNPTNPGNPDPGTPNPPDSGEATATANSAVLTTTRTTVYNLNSAFLTPSGWRPAALLEHEDNVVASSPRVAFDMTGNGLAVWALGNDMLMSRYTASSASWSAPVALDNGIDNVNQPHLAVDRHSGNAVAIWQQSDGVAESLYASSFDADTNSWSAPQFLEASNHALDSGANYSDASVSIVGSHAAVAWRQFDGTADSIFMARFVNGSWTVPTLLDITDQQPLSPEIAVDGNGNVIAVWRQFDAGLGENRIHVRRWDNTTQALGPVQLLSTNGDRLPRLQFDAQGNGFAIWSGDGVFARRFDAATNQWGAEIAIHNNVGATGSGELSVDATGNALAVWVEDDGTTYSLYSRRYDVATHAWGSAALLENSNVPVSTAEKPTVSMSGNEAVVSWIQDNASQDAYAIRLHAGAWGSATLLENNNAPVTELTSSIDASGNAAVLWVQSDGAARSIYQARYLSSNVIVPAGGTWQSLANTLYGVDSVEAGDALQAAMGGGALVEGAVLTGFPATLSVTTTIPAFYTVQATDTWSHIAQRVYGVTDLAAIDRLRALLGNPTLTAGLQLTLPAEFPYTVSANYSAPLDWSRVNTTTTTYHQLDFAALTVPLDDWSTATRLTAETAEALGPRIAFDAQGNGVAVWTQGRDLTARRYLASSGQWSAPVSLAINTNIAMMPRLALDRATGNAIVSWAQSDGVTISLDASSFDASNGSWSVAQALETTNDNVTFDASVSMSGEHAAIAWSVGVSPDVYMSRLVSATWTTPALVDIDAAAAVNPAVAVDGNGNTTVAWGQRDANSGDFRVYTRRWDSTTLAFGAVTAMNSSGEPRPRLGFDAQGNGVLLWHGLTSGTFARRFDAATDQWDAEVTLHAGTAAKNGELSVDASGDALAAWVETTNGVSTIQSSHYDASTANWGAAVAIADNMSASQLTASLVDDSAVVAWISEGGVNEDAYAARMQDGAWGTATLLETSTGRAATIASGMDSDDNATALWVQFDNAGPVIYQARSNSTPYYVVPAGATWRSLANALYGIDSDAAAEALEASMGQPTLTTGLQLQVPPTTLVVTPAVPTYYIVQSGDTWQSIALALYGTNRSEATAALWIQLGRPTLTVGQSLVIPSELAYTIDEE